MRSIFRLLVATLAALGLAAVDGSALAQGKGQDKGGQDKGKQEQQDQKDRKGGGGDKGDKDKKPKKAKHKDGKRLVGDKIKKDGDHKLEDHGKHSAFVKVKGGKVHGVRVKHAEKGDVPVKKYKTTKKMVEAPSGGIQPVSLILTQAGSAYLGETWIGYAYIDDWGEEVIYWFPYDMVYDYDTGAIEYIPAY